MANFIVFKHIKPPATSTHYNNTVSKLIFTEASVKNGHSDGQSRRTSTKGCDPGVNMALPTPLVAMAFLQT